MAANQNPFSCDCSVVHETTVQMVRTFLPDIEHLESLSMFYRVFGDLTRAKILSALAIHEMCVCDIATLFSMTKSAISHQLRTLREANLVKSRRDGKEVFYSLDDDHVVQVLVQGISHVQEKSLIKGVAVGKNDDTKNQ